MIHKEAFINQLVKKSEKNIKIHKSCKKTRRKKCFDMIWPMYVWPKCYFYDRAEKKNSSIIGC